MVRRPTFLRLRPRVRAGDGPPGSENRPSLPRSKPLPRTPAASSSAERPPSLAIASGRGGRFLKYRADRGPVLYAIALFALHLALWLWATPFVALAAVLPLTLGSIFVAAIHHHHQHLNTFRAPALNRVYDLVLALQTGVAPYAWVLHHNLGHHAHYLQQRPHAQADESTWTRADGTQMGRVEYTLDMLLRHQLEIVRVGRRHPRPFRYFLWMKLPLYGLIGGALWFSPLNTLLVFLVPGLLTLVHTIWATYEHHAGCGTESHLEASVNRTSWLYNRLTGNLGYHTAHHMRPGLHWSLLPKLHAEIAHEIPSGRVLTGFW